MKTDYVWTESYKAAILETDDTRLPGRLREAKIAIDNRLHDLQLDHGGTGEERQAISDALAGLNVLRRGREREARSHEAVCRICGKPVPLEECKADENGKVVHENCYVGEVLRLAAARPK